jgi:hypothetical protein
MTGTRVFDILTYRLGDGARDEFERILRTEALPLLERLAIPVVAFGPSLHDERGHAPIRSSLALGTQREARRPVRQPRVAGCGAVLMQYTTSSRASRSGIWSAAISGSRL